MAHEEWEKNPRHGASEARLTAGSSVGVWSRAGELLGRAKRSPEGRGALKDYAHCSVSRGTGERGIRLTLHAFDGGGYRVLVEEWEEGEHRAFWLAPMDEEEESYVGLFSEEEVKERFPYLLAALELPDGVEVCGDGA